MSISMLLDMAAAGDPGRAALVSDDLRVTTAELSDMAGVAAESIARSGAGHVAYVGTGGIMMPLLLFGAAPAGRAFTPLNYRLGAAALRELGERLPAPLVIVDTTDPPVSCHRPEPVSGQAFQISRRSRVLVTVASSDRVLSTIAAPYSAGTPATASRGRTTS